MNLPTKNRTAHLTLALLGLMLSPPGSADFFRGMYAYEHHDFQRARTEFLQSALEGHAESQFYLGEIYEGGVGVAADQARALQWYSQAAQQGHANAQRRLAYLYDRGQGTERNAVTAFEWYLRSAGNGDVLAQYKVGQLYAAGQGTKKDLLQAYKWLTIAAWYGDPDALDTRSNLDKRLSKAEKARALSLAREWGQ